MNIILHTYILGTLADSWKLGFDATQVVLKNNNIDTITEELYHECTRYCTPDRLARHAGLVPEDGDEFQKVGDKLAQEFDELYVGLVSLETAGFYNGIQNLILDLPQSCEEGNKHVKVAALTNACVAYAHSVLKINCPVLMSSSDTENKEKGGIYARFTSIHGADTVPEPKPDPSGLFQCCSEIELDPKVCVYIGDSPSDAVAAKKADMVAIGVLWGSHPLDSLKKAPFDYLCETVDELRDLLIE
jgi:phosphoglycolate phosphatase-like HAD superfamily hydrolase